jgi:hypothetical protein
LREFLTEIIERHETTRGTSRPTKRIDYEALKTFRDAERLTNGLEGLCLRGVLEPIYGTGGFRGRIEGVKVKDFPALYSALGMVPRATLAKSAADVLRDEAQDWEIPVIDHIEDRWARRKTWQRLEVEDTPFIRVVQRLARAIHDGHHRGMDFRTFSSRHSDDSKFLEENQKPILSYLFHGRDAPAGTLREILEAAGSAKITYPVFVSGAFAVRELRIGEAMSYVGIPLDDLGSVSLIGVPDYILTVENLASFVRHATEVNASKDGIVIFTGGQPSQVFRKVYARLLDLAGDAVPVFHWSDIDVGGIEISRTILAMCPRMRGHLMDENLLDLHGRKALGQPLDIAPFAGTWMEGLAARMADRERLVLEQERLDPVSPV